MPLATVHKMLLKHRIIAFEVPSRTNDELDTYYFVESITRVVLSKYDCIKSASRKAL